jgi:GntR family transcriptional repressor for pyruvate dehydrogenase complex
MARQPTLTVVDGMAGLTAPLGRKTVSELVVQRILDLVRAGSLKAGDRLPTERELASRLDVSRPSVREALRALSILGVLEIRHGGGAFVTSLDASDLLSPFDLFVTLDAGNMASLFDARIEFEPLVARLAAGRMDADGVGRLRRLVAAQLAAPEDAEVFHDTDVEFHKSIMDAAGNLFLSRIGKLLQVLGDQGRQALQRRLAARLQSIADHEAILVAFEARDPEAARRAMRDHMVHVRDALREATGA